MYHHRQLTLCMLGIFHAFCGRLLSFFKINFYKTFFQEHYQSVKQCGSRSRLNFSSLTILLSYTDMFTLTLADVVSSVNKSYNKS